MNAKKSVIYVFTAVLILFLTLNCSIRFGYAKNTENLNKDSRYIFPLTYFKNRPVKIIEQLTQNRKRWPIALKSLAKAGYFLTKRHIKYSIIIAAYGPGLKAFVMKYDKKYAGVIETLHKEGIKIVVCGESMKESQITPEMLFPFVKIASPGILGYIAEKEDQGYAYLKP
ncbi:MAG: DsrE family protein [bacterium]